VGCAYVVWAGVEWVVTVRGSKVPFCLGERTKNPSRSLATGKEKFLKCLPKCHTCPSSRANLRLLSAVVLMLSAVALISVQGYAPSASVVPAVSASRSAARFMRMSAPESGTFSEDLGIPCEGDCEAVYSKLPSSVKPGVVTGQALVDLLDYAKARRPDQPAHHTTPHASFYRPQCRARRVATNSVVLPTNSVRARRAQAEGFAIPAVNCISSSSINACLEAARKNDAPIMIQVHTYACTVIGCACSCSCSTRRVRTLLHTRYMPHGTHTRHSRALLCPFFPAQFSSGGSQFYAGERRCQRSGPSASPPLAAPASPACSPGGIAPLYGRVPRVPRVPWHRCASAATPQQPHLSRCASDRIGSEARGSCATHRYPPQPPHLGRVNANYLHYHSPLATYC
jgi:hypothetical protein